ncbi:Succinyl-CoA ligase [ADP-forming] subunit beta [Anaerohalosphaera lusitana]|uniref:Succinyl-CoA ligase [ADP-forming] subunit beta n=1 Tax=Anaerohalosphaera lusitana TaxID=1936003 RepID=A0A1U9NR79_9BACT|nr:ATP-grasp domain-containing protein [Anaerohalosphaera lusitana]AQT70287.1 Succinyl-CoA ligase [ADP-forming] subunit beta [Anaerohalosphaera lusitana]
MAAQITELTFLEHLAGRFKLPVPEYVTAESGQTKVRELLKKWGGKAIVKPDVLAGKRGKAGVLRQVNDYVDAQRELKIIQGTEVQGQLPRTSYMVEFIPSEMEVYSAITYDSRYLGPSITISLDGGMDVEEIGEEKKVTLPLDIYKGLGAYQASEVLEQLGCPRKVISPLSRSLVDLWDMFISTGMRMCEVNPWRITPAGKPYACDFKAIFDESNFKFKNIGFDLPEYPANATLFEEEMAAWNASSHRGQAHVSELGGKTILPLLFGGGASTIITETLMQNGGDPIFLSDFGGNPPYERMYGTAKLCFEHNLGKAGMLLILGGKANNTLIDVTFKAIADALQNYVDEHGPINIPVVVGRGGPRLLQGLLTLKDTLDTLGMPYVMFGPDTPVTQVAEYAAKLANNWGEVMVGGSK